MKKLMLFFFAVMLVGRMNVLAYDCSFLSADEFMLYENADAGQWSWQLYAATDNVYIDADMFSSGKRYLSTDVVNNLSNGENQLFFGVKAFRVPYVSEVVIEMTNAVTGEAKDMVKVRVMKNDELLFPVDKEWCSAEELNRASDIKTAAKTGDVIRFIVAPQGEKPDADFKINWSPEIVLRSNGRFVKNAELTVSGEGAVYDAVEGFSDMQGKNGWSYMCRRVRDGKEYMQECYSQSDYAWKSALSNNRGRIGNDFMLPGIEPTTPFDVMRVFTAPEDGVVTITADGQIEAYKKDITDDFGVKIRVLHNGKKIYPIDADWEYIESRDETINFEKFSLNVKKGDLISFETGRTINHGQAINMRQNILRWNPEVVYDKTAEVRFDLANYSQQSASFYPVIVTYENGMLKSAMFLDKETLSENEQLGKSLSVAFSGCTELKIILLENIEEIKPCDSVTKLNDYVREVR